MKQVEIDAQIRTDSGKGVARKLRKDGQVPGVLYGPKTDTISIFVNRHELNKLLIAAKGEQLLFSLNLRDNGQTSKHLTLIKELQRHPVNDEIRHIDFYKIYVDEEVTVNVPIAVTGKAKGVEEGGVLEIIQRGLEISCLPLAIPKEIQIDVTELGIGEAMHVKDITPPEGVRFLNDPDTTLLTIVGPEAKQAEEEAEEGEEGEEAGPEPESEEA